MQIVQEHSVVPREVEGFSAADKQQFGALQAAKVRDVQARMSR